MRPCVSILIPVYNVEKYLGKCLDSVLRQTLMNIEIICVNDGSTDGSLEILKKYQKQDNRIIIVNKENGGLPSARNAGIERATGEYIGFVDSDDYVESNMFQKLYETAEQDNSEIVICGAHIFPESPRAGQWLYSCLSPQYGHYKKFDSRLLFDFVYTTPFLWRVFVKRSLIERHHLRLDENILLGEDKNFQAKIYPKAKGVTVIPDKLYHYCWYRENSMMQKDVYHISDKKAKGHAALVRNIGEMMMDEDAETRRRYLRWCIPFLYADFIYLPLKDKIELAPDLVECWIKCGYYSFHTKFESWVAEQFLYFDEISRKKARKIDISIVMTVDNNAEYIREALNSIYSQSLKNIEIILINNGAPNGIYTILHRNLFQDERVRLYNMAKSTYAKALNAGLTLAEGEYTMFFESSGWMVHAGSMRQWFEYARERKADICASPYAIVENRGFEGDIFQKSSISIVNERQYYNLDFHNVLYRTEYLREKKLVFKEGAILTGSIFLMESLMRTKVRNWYDRYTYIQRKMFLPDWISTQKVEKLLSLLSEVMELSLEKEDYNAHAKVLALVNGDYLKKIIVNNTRAYSMPEEQCPHGENSQIETLKYLYKIMQLVNPELLKKGGYDLTVPYTTVLVEVIQERQKFLADISDNYCWG